MTVTTLLIVSGTIIAIFVGFTVAAPTFLNFPHFAQRFRLDCPNYHTGALVNLSAMAAALTAAYGKPWLKVQRCNLLRPGEKCHDEGCLKQMVV
ncbi:MAG: hypothetical protein IID61_15540 [SAR324 cluster bacterium]|nr:hypothetical protein [SAR324 cluster bacterium]